MQLENQRRGGPTVRGSHRDHIPRNSQGPNIRRDNLRNQGEPDPDGSGSSDSPRDNRRDPQPPCRPHSHSRSEPRSQYASQSPVDTRGNQMCSEGNKDYQQRLVDTIRLLIKWMVSTQPIYPSNFKAKQQSTPETYSGTNDIEVFNNWLRSILRHSQLTKMCGPDYDELCTTQMGQYLKDTAATWF